jgi:3-isopropylmalate dehydratase small subunit
MSNDNKISGKVIKLGDNIDTDVMSPAKFGLSAAPTDEEWAEMKLVAFSGVRKDLYKQVKPGDILVAGHNFGCGSHRIRSNIILKHLGFQAVLAETPAKET